MSEQNRRREQPKAAVKEKKGGLLDGIFGGLKNPVVPVAAPAKPQEAAIRTQETLPPRTTPKVPASGAAKPKSSTRPARLGPDRQSKSKGAVIYVLLVIAVSVFWFGYQKANVKKVAASRDGQGIEAEAPVTDLRERVEYYRRSVGHKLNRERVGAEYENRSSAPRLPRQSKKTVEADMMNGLPLATEQHHRASSRDRAEPVNPDYSDAHVAYSLREQQQLNEDDRRAQKQYVDEFVANAAKAGYKVKVDKNGNVDVVGRLPAAGAPSGPSSSGSMQ